MRKLLKAPSFWYQPSSILAKCLWPVSLGYAATSWLDQQWQRCEKVAVPVICVGNLVVGGAGKTPTVIALANLLKQAGCNPHIISRGYGSRQRFPVQVEINTHSFLDVGDEPLLLAKHAPTWVGADRVASAKQAIKAGANVILMDDGFQNQRLYKDLSLLVIDGNQGVGNGYMFPAGPLRQSPQKGLLKADAVIFIGKAQHDYLQNFEDKIIPAIIEPLNPKPKKCIAFAGLGYPKKFYQTLRQLGYEVVKEISYPDHYIYTLKDLEELKALAHQESLKLLTTEKDLLRIPAQFHNNLEALRIDLQFNEKDRLQALFKGVLR